MYSLFFNFLFFGLPIFIVLHKFSLFDHVLIFSEFAKIQQDIVWFILKIINTF